MEFTCRCKVCGHNEAWTTERAAQAAATWHVFEEHPIQWLEILLDAGEEPRPPQDPRPEEFGTRYEQWERQS